MNWPTSHQVKPSRVSSLGLGWCLRMIKAGLCLLRVRGLQSAKTALSGRFDVFSGEGESFVCNILSVERILFFC